MTRIAKTRKMALACGAVAVAVVSALVVTPALGGRQDQAVIRAGGVVLRANGGVKPMQLPSRRFAPIALRGYANVRGRGGAAPPPLERVALNVTRNSRVQTRGLPICSPERLEGKGARAARRACGGALVATGNVEASIDPPDTPRFPVRAPVAVFNGPLQDGRPTMVFHAHVSLPGESAFAPSRQTYVVQEPLLPSRHGNGFRVDVDVPEIANGYGSVTHGSLKFGKRLYRYRGQRRSFISARCPTGVLFVWGRLGFADGTVISGTLSVPCRPRQGTRR